MPGLGGKRCTREHVIETAETLNQIMTGDLVLRNVAQILKSSYRREDMVARYGGEEFGGEEFAIILPETDSARPK